MVLLWGGALFQAARFDELYHVLAARGWLETGTYRIGTDGRYLRGVPITWSVAQLFWLLGDYLFVARLVSLIPTAILVLAGSWWLSTRFNRPLGYAWATICVLSPFLVEIATFVRWYGLLALLAGLFLACLVELLLPDRSPRDRTIAAMLLAFAAAGISVLQLEILAPLLLFGTLMAARLILPAWPRPRIVRALLMVGLLAGLAVVAGLASGVVTELWAKYRWSVPWAADASNDPIFYHRYLLIYYPVFWPLTGMLWLAGRRIAPALADCAVLIAGTGLLFHAGAGLKATRYIGYLAPWLHLIWAIGLVGLWHYLRQLPIAWPASRWGQAIVAAAVVFVILGNAASIRVVSLALGITVPPEQPSADWHGVARILSPETAETELIISPSELEALDAFGRADYALNHSLYVEVQGQGPVTVDPRTGVKVLRDPEALHAVLTCARSALVVSDTYRWRDPGKAPDAMATYVEQELLEITLPPDSHMRAWRWENFKVQATDC